MFLQSWDCKIKGHFGSQTEHAMRNGERSEDGCPKSPLNEVNIV